MNKERAARNSFKSYIENSVSKVSSIVASETITGAVSTKSFTPVSVINHRDGVSYYKNGNLRKNEESSGYTSVTLYDDEFEKNEAKRKIKIISPNIISNVVRRFEQVMKS